MPYLVLGLVVALLGATAGVAQTSEAQPLIDRMLEALGGRQQISALRSLSVEAACSGPGGGFRTSVDSLRPGAVRFHQVADDGSAEIWSTEAATWHLDDEGEPAVLPGPTRYFVRSHEFHLLLFEIESRFSDHSLGGWSDVDGRRCRSIEMTDGSGQPASLCVAESDGLPLQLEMNPPGAEGPVRITFGDWRQIDGLWYFFHFDLTEGPARSFTYDYDRIEPDDVDALSFVQPAPAGRGEEQEEILAVLRADRRAHLETDAALLASHVADELLEISGGRVNRSTRAEVETLFESIFEGARYELWEDAEPPVVRLSRDASMAWVARRVLVRRQAPGPDGELQAQEFTSAYTATYERRDGEWWMTSVTSTFLAPPP